ncbi:hypothetical protein J3A84_11145 [Proteiniclasticum sp. SCR006]|uniref:Antigen I/II N-terminal domain-containing protein n=1 Tax=Proteiniclasticum aestuarii TaxID=2817862 RepID=A0A939KLE3_9CLOT|nr:hypothetical protein [Proteiniclasticum aestuarii]MBO1265590.1 hypothetical protein [Proteiniclasticum aestuarii]
MKKTAIFLVISMLIMTMAGCAGKNENQESQDAAEKQQEEVSVDKNLLSVEIILPPDFAGDLSDFDKESYLTENPGMKDAEVLGDGSLKLTMSRAKHKELMEEMRESVDEAFNMLMNDEETSYIKDVRRSDDYRKVDVIVDRTGYENAFDFSSLTIMMSVAMYQVFEGNELELLLRYLDEETEEVIDEMKLPEEL